VHESTLQEFKSAFDKNIENMKEDDADLYFKPIVEVYIDKLMGSCEGNFQILIACFSGHRCHLTEVDLCTDLKEFDLDYLCMIRRVLRKKMQSYVAINTVRVKVTWVESF
jgi:hypothetical protein